jgi:WD40 repeat protein
MNRFRRAIARGLAVPAFPCVAAREDHRLRVAGALFAVGALLALWLVAGLSLGSAPAQATFPGENGRIACEGDRTPQPDPVPRNFAPTEIFTVNPDGSDERVLTRNLVTDGDPAFSPDGQKIAFNSTRDGDSEIYSMNVDGTDVRRLTTSPGTDRQPTWSPDGSRIVFHSGRDRNPDGSINFEVYMMNADGSDQRNLTNSPGQDAVPSWSPDGTRIAFQGLRAGNLEIHRMNRTAPTSGT